MIVPKVLFHRVLGGYAGLEDEVDNVLEAVELVGLVPEVATAYNNLVPKMIRDLPIVWLSERIDPGYDVLAIDTTILDSRKLYPLDVSGVNWWVYEGTIPVEAITRYDSRSTSKDN